MTRRLVAPAALAALAALAFPAHAQVRGSEKGTVSQSIAGTVITLEYSRPSLRGRDSIFGTQVPWDAIWTPGANNVTTLATTRAIRLNGQHVAAGKYGVWIEIRRDSAWVFHLHADTARWHLPRPPRTEMLLSFPIQIRRAPTPETLTWLFDRVRAGGAELQMQWGNTVAVIDLAIDTPTRTTLDAAVAARYEGSWTEYRASDSTRARGRTARLWYDQGTHQLLSTLPEGETPEGDVRWSLVYIPRAEGVFARGYTMNGELAFAGADGQQSLVEFTLRNGRAVSYVVRNPRDSIVARGERAATP